MATFLWRAAGEPAPVRTYNPFRDVKSGSYYYDAVPWAVENSITAGMTGATFEPGRICNRGQTAKFLYRLLAK